ncbi:MAG TPA: hypothetical protein VNA25_19530 [Phycisphaerae bacterium]|nr:hypothetical protein [Phycisphaerae bacterium]
MPQMGPPDAEPAATIDVDWGGFDTNSLVEDIEMSPEEEGRISAFMGDEIRRSFQFLRGMHTKTREFREQYEEERKKKDWPWEEASNVAVSMTSPHVNQAVGRNFRTIRSTTPAIMIDALPGISQKLSDPKMVMAFQDFLNAKILQDDTFCTRIFEWMLESAITGTGVAKVFWDRVERPVGKYAYGVNEDSGEMSLTPRVEHERMVRFEGSRLEVVPIEDVFLPPEAVHDPDAIENSHWVAQRYRERFGVVVDKARRGIYRMDQVMDLEGEADQSASSSENVFLDSNRTNEFGNVEAPTAGSANELILYEFHVRWDPVGDGEERDCVFFYSYSHEKILGAKYLPFFHGRRPFVSLPYLRRSDSFFGRGIPDQLKHTQRAGNDILNSGLDALTLANIGLWVASKGSGIKTGRNDRIWAGRILTLDDPASLRRLDTGNPSPNTMEFVKHVDLMAQRASSVGEGLQGGEGPQGNNETAEGALARMGNVTPIFDVILDEVRRAVSVVAEMYLSNYQQFMPGGDKYLSYAQYGEAMSKELKMPHESIVGKYRVRVVTSTVGSNSEIRKATLQHLMATIGPLFGEIIEAVNHMGSPETPDVALPIMESSLKVRMNLARQLLHAYELPGASEMLPDFDTIWPQMKQQIQQMREQAKNAPKPLSDTIARLMAPKFDALMPDEEIDLLHRLGFKAERRQDASGEGGPPGGPGGKDGGPPPAGAGGAAGPPG